MDNETGEIMISTPTECLFDAETGECVGTESDQSDFELIEKAQRKKSKFNVPKSYLRQPLIKKETDSCCLKSKEIYTLTPKERVIELKEKIILGYNKTSHRLFLLPSLFLFPKIAALIILVTEITLHVWSHQRNSRNDNPSTYYRSPLHALTSQFCNFCRETKSIHNDRYHKKKI